ncbi:MAG: phosphate ABC transporter permease PstA [Bacteroidota bacterium]|nr:phosphate ABC transporter permease PstA [Bacteroidota bacterium]
MMSSNARYTWRKSKNVAMVLLTGMSLLLVVGVLILILTYTVSKGINYINWDLITEMPAPVGETGGGMANAIMGSAILVALGSLYGIPVGLLAGVYLAQTERGWFARTVRFLTEVLNGIPSIVIGVVAFIVVVIPMQRFSALAGGFALGIIMIPLITRTTEEMIRLVPSSFREAGLALGLPRWRTTVSIILPAAFKGIFTGVFLSIARAIGETAPLLFTALGNRFWSTELDQPIASMTVFIYDYARAPFDDWNQQAWAASFVLIVIVFALNLMFRLVTRKTYTA